ncbi:hypothetical protein V6N12_066900 [Hibiscus sabdariffa]|uniref:Uncharacterized protein n=1 Tax=Hibiscus sabdariffa TaxID=183260 RepID=A0ABR2C9I6_9ROSI
MFFVSFSPENAISNKIIYRLLQRWISSDYITKKNCGFKKRPHWKQKSISCWEEKAALDLKGANLEENIEALEKEKESWILTENSTKETISILNRDITRLKMQYHQLWAAQKIQPFALHSFCSDVEIKTKLGRWFELEESRSKLSQENQQLTNTASSLQLHIRNLEKNVTPRPSSSSDEVEKVNELSVKLKRQTMAAGYSMVNEMSDPGTHSMKMALFCLQSWIL